jgi:glycosyltransferase involved in cell wall biosynthesis
MHVSLVVATRGRDRDIAVLLDSLLVQDFPALDVTIVDQNADDRVVPIVADYAPRLSLRHLRSDVTNANHARNLGLHAASGDLVGFPDDDCIFPPGVLARVEKAFTADPSLQVLTGPAASPEGGLGSGRWRTDAGAITLRNVWTSVIEFNLFLRRETAVALGGFDERLGPGTRFGSAEGNDLVARAISLGHRATYDPDLRIVHPDKRLTPVAVERAQVYATGLGLVLRRHAPDAGTWLPFFVRPLGGMALSALRLRQLEFAYYAATLRGRIAGWFATDPGRAR